MYTDYLPQNVAELENTLRRKEYKAPDRLVYGKLSAKLREGVYKMDGVVSFGDKVITLLEDMTEELHRLPTADEYIDRGMMHCEDFWKKHRNTNRAIGGYPFNKGVRLGVTDRLLRAYNSKITELHLKLLLESMGFKTFEHPLVDSVMGVDLVVENASKRYYIHVTTSKQGEAAAILSVMGKEDRGNIKYKGKWIKYKRDFTGDIVLCYSYRDGSGSTKKVNGIPLFTRDYLDFYFELKQISRKHGEKLSADPTKLDIFRDWASETLNENIEAF